MLLKFALSRPLAVEREFGLEIAFISLACNHNKYHLLNISFSTSFATEFALALEIEFFCQQLNLELLKSGSLELTCTPDLWFF
jgi:hypothetical protein